MDPHQKLTQLVAKRDALKSEQQKMQGRLESARASLADIEKECASKGIPIDQLDDAIVQLQARLDAGLQAFEEQLGSAEDALAPYLR